MIPIYKPYLPKKSLDYVHEALKSSWISSHGKFITLVQDKLQDLLKLKHVLLVNNGTSATHLVAKALSFKYPKINNIIVPNNVFVAAINSFLFDNKFKLYSIDCDINTWNISFENLKKFDKNKQLLFLIVHNIGNIINVPMLKKEYPNWIFVEDNCEGFLGKYNNEYSGTASLASSISFFGNKNITCGEGGAFVTNDSDIFEYTKCIHGQGQSDEKFLHKELGYNYRITNVQAAILAGQLDIISEIIEKKHNVFEKYKKFFKNIDNILMQKIEETTIHSNWMFGIRIKNSDYEFAKIFFAKHNIEIRPMFYPINKHNHLINNNLIKYKYDIKNNNASILNNECIILPSYPSLKNDEINYICSTVKKYSDIVKKYE